MLNRVEWKQAHAIHRNRIVVVLHSNRNCNHGIMLKIINTVLTCTGVPAVTKFQYTLLSRFPIDSVLREMLSMLQNITPDSAIAVFRSQDAVRTLSPEAVYVRYVPSRSSVSVSVCARARSACTLCFANTAMNIQSLSDCFIPY